MRLTPNGVFNFSNISMSGLRATAFGKPDFLKFTK